MNAQIQFHNAHGVGGQTRKYTFVSVQEARGFVKRELRQMFSRAYAYLWIDGKRICIQQVNGKWEVTEN